MPVRMVEEITDEYDGQPIVVDGFPCISIRDSYKDRTLFFRDYDNLAAWASQQQVAYLAHRAAHIKDRDDGLARAAQEATEAAT